MELLFISNYQFTETDGAFFSLPAYGDAFWQKYLNVFESLKVLGIEMKGYLRDGAKTKITDPRIAVEILPSNIHPKDFKNDKEIKVALRREIAQAEAILIKPSGRKGIMAIKLAKEMGKPYMVELTGDLRLTLSTHPSLLKRLYSPIIHHQITRAIKDAPFGLYVTERYLQKVYPISGKQCGITDSVIDSIDEAVLDKKLQKIESMGLRKTRDIGLIGSYNGNRKGVDTAIKALSLLGNKDVRLNILYNGAEKDRRFWREYAKKYGVEDQLSFPEPRKSVEDVMAWIDTQDIIILPSRSEGLPRCIVEAMSRACPCITSNVCGLPELISEEWVHGPSDHKTLARMMTDMLSSPRKMEQEARTNFENSRRFLRETLTAKRDEFLKKFRDYCERQGR